MEEKKYKQHCGDTLEILEEAYKKNGYIYYKCKFLKYPCEVYALLGNIVKGTVLNPQIEQVEFFDKLWSQNCGDILRIIKKSEKTVSNGVPLYECEFINYPYKILARKYHIIQGTVKNPQIEIKEFINKIWPQNCGDFLKVIKKTDKKIQRNCLYECEFINYPYKTFALKVNILKGAVNNPQIEQIEFVNKIWPQNCGDSLKIIECRGNKDNKGIWLCEFIKYPYKIICLKQHILLGNVNNPNLPLFSKEKFIEFLQKYQELNNKKIKIEEICTEFNRAKRTILDKISEFEAYDYIDYNF